MLTAVFAMIIGYATSTGTFLDSRESLVVHDRFVDASGRRTATGRREACRQRYGEPAGMLHTVSSQ